jgi:hypothetical protein
LTEKKERGEEYVKSDKFNRENIRPQTKNETLGVDNISNLSRTTKLLINESIMAFQEDE